MNHLDLCSGAGGFSLAARLARLKIKQTYFADIGESNIIESEADVIMFLHRPHVYFPEANPYEAELIIAKNRHGEEDTKRLKWIGEFTQFTNY